VKIKNATLLLLALTLTLAAVAPVELPAQSGAYCEGDCNGSEIFFSCPSTMSAFACCTRVFRSCGGSFNGICSGDEEILCS
jgi:hypothetical protein